MELEQCCWLDERAKLHNPARAQEQRGESEYEAIERGQIRRALPESITDQELIFEQKRLRGDGAYATWAEQLCEGDQQVDGEDEEFARGANRRMTVSACKTAPYRLIPSYYEFATRTFQFDWSEEGLVVGGIYYWAQVAHMKLCASRAFWLVAYPSQGHEMLFDARTRSFAALGRPIARCANFLRTTVR